MTASLIQDALSANDSDALMKCIVGRSVPLVPPRASAHGDVRVATVDFPNRFCALALTLRRP